MEPWALEGKALSNFQFLINYLFFVFFFFEDANPLFPVVGSVWIHLLLFIVCSSGYFRWGNFFECVLCLAVKLTTGGSVENWKPKGRVFFCSFGVSFFFNPLKLSGRFLSWLTPELLMKNRAEQSCWETHKPNISLEGVNIYPGRRR